MRKTEAAPPRYAAKTEVPVEKTKADVEKLLVRYGATGFITAWQHGQQTLVFEMKERRYRFRFALCTEEDVPRLDSQGRRLTIANMPGGSIQGAVDQANRTRWRELLLGLKAKLVMVEAGITTLEEEFLAAVVLPNNQTAYEWMAPQLKQLYAGGKMPPLLPGASGPEAIDE